jgi:hypothetical protein
VTPGKDLQLVDWFAGHALQGLLAGPNAPKKSAAESPEQYALRVAEEAYIFADAMLRTRAQRGTQAGAGATDGS